MFLIYIIKLTITMYMPGIGQKKLEIQSIQKCIISNEIVH